VPKYPENKRKKKPNELAEQMADLAIRKSKKKSKK